MTIPNSHRVWNIPYSLDQIADAQASFERKRHTGKIVLAVHLPEHHAIEARVKAVLADAFGIGYVTLDIEAPDEECDHPGRIGSASRS